MTSPSFASPLRYPGGKGGFQALLTEIISRNNMSGCTYAEPFAGGAGAALSILYAEQVSRILINDIDPKIASFWRSVLDQTDAFVRLLRRTKPTLWQWRRQRSICLNADKHEPLEVGFATFFLNRCNRSGIIKNGGPIGGHEQLGEWGSMRVGVPVRLKTASAGSRPTAVASRSSRWMRASSYGTTYVPTSDKANVSLST